MTRVRWFSLVAMIGWLLAGMGCASNGDAPKKEKLDEVEIRVVTQRGTRVIRGRAEGFQPLTMELHPVDDRAVFTANGHQVLVELEQISVDGKTTVKIDPAASRFEIVYSYGLLAVVVEGTNLLTVRVEKVGVDESVPGVPAAQ